MSIFIPALVLVLSVASNWAVWSLFRAASFQLRAPDIVADVPDLTFDWRGLA